MNVKFLYDRIKVGDTIRITTKEAVGVIGKVTKIDQAYDGIELEGLKNPDQLEQIDNAIEFDKALFSISEIKYIFKLKLEEKPTEPTNNIFTFNVEKEGVFIPMSPGTSSTIDSRIGELFIVEPGGFVFQDELDNLEELDPEFVESGFEGSEEQVNETTDEPNEFGDPIAVTDNQTPTSPVTGSPISPSKLYGPGYKGILYIGVKNVVKGKVGGVAGHRLINIITDLEKYLRANGFSGAKLSSNGIMRDLPAAAATSNPKRVPGSLHGAGLAIDLKFDIPGFGCDSHFDERKRFGETGSHRGCDPAIQNCKAKI